jgi:hypothetical protein
MAAGDYPLPAYAGYIWDRGDCLVLQFEDGHRVELPHERCALALTDGGSVRADQRGWGLLLSLLRNRRNSYAAQRKPAIAEPGRETKYQIEMALLAKALANSVKPARSTSTDIDIFAQEEDGE